MKVVLTGGKFNKIHPGHIWLLKKAKKLGKLIVVLANDSHNRRPYAVSAKARKKNLAKLKIADKVVVGDPRRFVKVVYKYKPNVIVLGYDQKLPDKETKEAVRKMKIKVVRFRKHGNYKTGELG
jgi:FAD synthetase